MFLLRRRWPAFFKIGELFGLRGFFGGIDCLSAQLDRLLFALSAGLRFCRFAYTSRIRFFGQIWTLNMGGVLWNFIDRGGIFYFTARWLIDLILCHEDDFLIDIVRLLLSLWHWRRCCLLKLDLLLILIDFTVLIWWWWSNWLFISHFGRISSVWRFADALRLSLVLSPLLSGVGCLLKQWRILAVNADGLVIFWSTFKHMKQLLMPMIFFLASCAALFFVLNSERLSELFELFGDFAFMAAGSSLATFRCNFNVVFNSSAHT